MVLVVTTELAAVVLLSNGVVVAGTGTSKP